MREMVPPFAVGGQRDDRLAAFGARCAAQEVHLPADAAIELRADRVGANLPGQIDLQGRVDGHHVVVAGNQYGIVGVGRRMEFEDRVVVDEVEQILACPEQSRE